MFETLWTHTKSINMKADIPLALFFSVGITYTQ